MKMINIDQSVFKPIERKQKDKANTVFLKYYSRLNKPKNAFDEVKSTTYPIANERKPGEAFNDTI